MGKLREFGSGSGSGAGLMYPDSADRPFSSNNARNTWANNNKEELIKDTTVVNVDGNQWYLWTGESNPATVSASLWMDAAQIIQGPQGLQGEKGDTGEIDLIGLSSNTVPVVNDAGDTLVDSSITETADNIIMTKTLIVPQDSLQIGPALTVSDEGGNLGLINQAEDKQFLVATNPVFETEEQRNELFFDNVPRVNYQYIVPAKWVYQFPFTIGVSNDNKVSFELVDSDNTYIRKFRIYSNKAHTGVRIWIENLLPSGDKIVWQNVTEDAYNNGEGDSLNATGFTEIEIGFIKISTANIRFRFNIQAQNGETLELVGQNIDLGLGSYFYPRMYTYTQDTLDLSLSDGNDIAHQRLGGFSNEVRIDANKLVARSLGDDTSITPQPVQNTLVDNNRPDLTYTNNGAPFVLRGITVNHTGTWSPVQVSFNDLRTESVSLVNGDNTINITGKPLVIERGETFYVRFSGAVGSGSQSQISLMGNASGEIYYSLLQTEINEKEIDNGGTIDVIEFDVSLDSTRSINNSYVGKFVSITQSGQPVAIPMQITIDQHNSFNTGDKIKIGVSDEYVNYYFAVYYSDANNRQKVVYPAKSVHLIRTNSGWDVEKDGTYTNVAIIPATDTFDASQDNALLTPVSSIAFAEHPSVYHFDNNDGTRAIAIDLNSLDNTFFVDGNDTENLIIGGGINYAYDAATKESTISIDPTNISLDDYAELETDVVFSKVSIANDTDPAFVTVMNVTNGGNSEVNLVGTTNIRKVDKATGDTTDVIRINGNSGDVDFLTVPKKEGVDLATIEDVGEDITLNNDRIITPNNGSVFQLRDSDKNAGYGNNGSINYFQPQEAGQETVVNNNIDVSKSYFIHKEINTTSGFLILHEDYVTQIYDQDLISVNELTMLFGAKAAGRFGKANQTAPAGTIINWNGDYIPNTEDPQDLNPSQWIDKNGNPTNQWTKTGVLSPCYSIGALINDGTALLRRGDVTYQNLNGVKTTEFVADENSTLFVLPVKTGGGTFGDVKLFPFFMSRQQQSQTEWESYTFDNSADCVGTVLRIAYETALENANAEAEIVIGTEQLSSTGYGYKLFKFAEGMPYHGLISTPSGSRLIHEFPKAKTHVFTPIDAGRNYEGVNINVSNESAPVTLGQYSDTPLYSFEPNQLVARDQIGYINFPAGMTIDTSEGFYFFGTVSGWAGGAQRNGTVAVYVGTNSENPKAGGSKIGFALTSDRIIILNGNGFDDADNATASKFNQESGVANFYRFAVYVDNNGLMTYYIYNLNSGVLHTGTQQCTLSSISNNPKLWVAYDRENQNTSTVALGETHLVLNTTGDAEFNWNWRF